MQLPYFFHIGGMRTASTYLQNIFQTSPDIHLVLKSRFFSYDPYYFRGGYRDQVHSSFAKKARSIVDSDENYSLGRFKTRLIRYLDNDFNFRSELKSISHDLEKMADRLYDTVPEAKILMVIREQADWLKSVYKHDVYHFGVDVSFHDFMKSDLGQSYLNAGDYNRIWKIYVDRFGLSHVKFFLFEDLRVNEELFLRHISEYLGCRLDYPNLIGKSAKNVSPGDLHTRLLSIVNKLGRSEPGFKEYRHYYWLRTIVGKIFQEREWRVDLVRKSDTRFIKDHYRVGNSLLAREIGLESRMKEEGYF
jgi:hypothetical protein